MTTSLGRGLAMSLRSMSANSSPAIVAVFIAAILACSSSVAFGAQTRDQCEACCKNAGLDEYYAEQCRLKCFRHPDHCTQSMSRREPPPAAAQEAVREPAPSEPAPRPRASKFVWPNPLNVVPGKEWEAAAQILAINGIPQQHPNFQPALRSVQDVLINFARNNPAGGRLPTAQLEKILQQFR